MSMVAVRAIKPFSTSYPVKMGEEGAIALDVLTENPETGEVRKSKRAFRTVIGRVPVQRAAYPHEIEDAKAGNLPPGRRILEDGRTLEIGAEDVEVPKDVADALVERGLVEIVGSPARRARAGSPAAA